MRGVKVFYLDLICNALGAMLMLFFLMAARQQIRPTTRVAGTIYIEALSPDLDTEIGIWVKEPEAKGRVLFEDEIDSENGEDRTQASTTEPSRWFSGRAVEHHFQGFEHLRGGATALIQIRNPLKGCWEIGAYSKDDLRLLRGSEPVPVEGKLRVWYRKPLTDKTAWNGSPTEGTDRELEFTPIPLGVPTDGKARQLFVEGGNPCK